MTIRQYLQELELGKSDRRTDNPKSEILSTVMESIKKVTIKVETVWYLDRQ